MRVVPHLISARFIRHSFPNSSTHSIKNNHTLEIKTRLCKPKAHNPTHEYTSAEQNIPDWENLSWGGKKEETDCKNPKLGMRKSTGALARCWHVCSLPAGIQLRRKETPVQGLVGGGIACQCDRLYVGPCDRLLGETAAGDSPGNCISS